MKNPRKPSSPHFGPRLPSRLKVTRVSLVRKPRKHKSRFVSPIMKKIDEEVKKKQNIMRTISALNQANMVKSKSTTMSEHMGPSSRNVSKSNKSPSISSKVGSHSKYSPIMNVSSGKLDKATTSRPSPKLNGKLGPLELSRQTRMNQGSVHTQNPHLKAMRGLVHNKKGRSIGMQNKGGLGGTKDTNMRCEPMIELKIPGDGMQIECGLGGTKDKNMRRESSPEPEIPGDRMQSEGAFGGTKDRNMRCEPLPEPYIDPNIARKRRKNIEINDEDGRGAQGHKSEKDDSTRLPSDYVNLKDCHAKVSTSFVSNCVVQRCDCCSMPIDKPAWRGILKMPNKDYISLAGHLSTKSGEKVWNLSKSLRKVVEVTKVCRSDVWPKRWEASGPTSDNIGLYFFSYQMRPDKYLDRLVKEAMENDLALRAAIDEAEMLMFPSSLLPERYQLFQSKHYMWGVFRPRVVQGKHGDESRHVKNPTDEATAAVATNATTSLPAEATAVATNSGAVPVEAPVMPTTVPTSSQIDLSMGAPPGRVVSFVVRKTPKVEQLIQEMKREGALIVAMQGEMIAGDGFFGSQHDDRTVSRAAPELSTRHVDIPIQHEM